MQDLQAPSAQCPIHPGQLSRAACSRCGNYVCDVCTERGYYNECQGCRERGGRGFLFTRDAWTVGGLASHSWAAFKRDWVTLLIGMVLLGVTLMVMGGAQAGLQIAVLGFPATQTPYALKTILMSSATSAAMSTVVMPLMIGFIALCLSSLRGMPTRVGTMFAPYARFGTIAQLVLLFSSLGLVYNVIMSFFFADKQMTELYGTLAWTGLAALPFMFYFGTGWGFAYAVLADEPALSMPDVLRRSWGIATGRRWQIVSIWLICGATMAVGMMMCLLPAVIAIPWAALLWASSYLALATPTPSRDVVPTAR